MCGCVRAHGCHVHQPYVPPRSPPAHGPCKHLHMHRGGPPASLCAAGRAVVGTMNPGLRAGPPLRQGPGTGCLQPGLREGRYVPKPSTQRLPAFPTPWAWRTRHSGRIRRKIARRPVPYRPRPGPRRPSCSDRPVLSLWLFGSPSALLLLLQRTCGPEREAPRGQGAVPEWGAER